MKKKQSAGIDILFSNKGIIESINFTGATNNAERTSLLILLTGHLCTNITAGLKGEDLIFAVSEGMDKSIGELYDGKTPTMRCKKPKPCGKKPAQCGKKPTEDERIKKDRKDLEDALRYAERRQRKIEQRSKAVEQNKKGGSIGELSTLLREATALKRTSEQLFDKVFELIRAKE